MSKAVLEQELEPVAAQLPALPDSVREGFVKYVPIVTLVLLVISLPALLAAFALGGALFAFAGFAGIQTFIVLIIGIASLVFTIIALPGLFNRTRAGWVNEYYAQLLSVLGGVVGFNIIGVFFSLIWLYVLFQVRDAYK